MYGDSPVSEASNFVPLSSSVRSICCTSPLDSAVKCTLYFTTIPSPLLQALTILHFTKMAVGLTTSGHCTIRWTLYYCIDRTEPLTYYTYSCMYACADIHHAQLLYTLLRDILKVYPATLSSKCVLALSSMCTITHT